MHFGYSLYADHKEEHVIVKKENSNRTYYDEVNSDKTSFLSRTILVHRVLVSNYIYVVLTRFLVSAMLIVLGVFLFWRLPGRPAKRDR